MVEAVKVPAPGIVGEVKATYSPTTEKVPKVLAPPGTVA